MRLFVLVMLSIKRCANWVICMFAVLWFRPLSSTRAPGAPLCCVDPLGWAVFSTFSLLCSLWPETSSSVYTTRHYTEQRPTTKTHADLWHKVSTALSLSGAVIRDISEVFHNNKSVLLYSKVRLKVRQSRDELWKQLGQLACFLCCSGHLQLHYMLTYCKWHCATHLRFSGTEPCARVAGPRSAPGLSATSNDLQNLNTAKYFHLNKSVNLSVARHMNQETEYICQICWLWSALEVLLMSRSLCKVRICVEVNGLSRLQSAKWTRALSTCWLLVCFIRNGLKTQDLNL